MSITTHRTIEHTYTDGDQSVIEIQTIKHDSLIDGSQHSILLSNGNESVSIQSRDQLERLINGLRYVADRVLDGEEKDWNV